MFLYLLVTVTLYAIAVSAMALLFQYVNYFLPDPLDYQRGATEALRTTLSILIIFTPVYVWATRFLNKDMLANPAKHGLAIRRWLVHLTLFVSGITIMVDLATLVYNVLGGEFTSRFILKVLAVLLVAAAVFAYYIWDIKREAKEMPAKMTWLARTSLVVLLVAVVGGFFIIESPADQRQRALDDERVEHLWEVETAVENYWWQNEELPESLDVIDSELPVDPGTEEAYEYALLSDTSYELCATFAFEGEKDRYARPVMIEGILEERSYYNHEAGRDCFERSVETLK